MTIDEKIAMMERVLHAYDARIQKLEGLAGGNLRGDFEKAKSRLQQLITSATAQYEQYCSTKNIDYYKSYLQMVNAANHTKEIAEKLKTEIDGAKKQLKACRKAQDKTIENIRALKREKESQERNRQTESGGEA